MAIIKTIDGLTHTVKESIEEVYNIINSQECLKVGVVPLSRRCSICGFEDGQEITKWVYEPAFFMRSAIMMYY
jgi:hypothetical protein